jgi:hypothetical protein
MGAPTSKSLQLKIDSAIEQLNFLEKNFDSCDSQELYAVAVVLDDASLGDTSYDDKATQALDLCLSSLTFHDHGEVFLDAWKRYIRLLMKYKQWYLADSFLKLYESLIVPQDLTGWFYNSVAKVQYEIFAEESFCDPKPVLTYLNQAVQFPEGVNQAKSIFRDFLQKAKEFFDTKGKSGTDYHRFISELRLFISLLEETESNIWPELADQLDTRVSLICHDNLEPRQHDNEIQEELIKAYEDKIDELTIELITAYSEIERLKKVLDARAEQHEQPGQVEVSASSRQLKILILGASQIKTKDILGIAKRFGLSKENLELHLDYTKNKRFDLEKIRWVSPYSGIMVGPIAHKVVGLGDNDSVLHTLDEEGFPPCYAIRSVAGELKITKSSLLKAFDSLLNKIGAYDPDM